MGDEIEKATHSHQFRVLRAFAGTESYDLIGTWSLSITSYKRRVSEGSFHRSGSFMNGRAEIREGPLASRATRLKTEFDHIV